MCSKIDQEIQAMIKKQSDSRDAIQRFEVGKRHPPSTPSTFGQNEISGGYLEYRR
jgi:hypothetical protein